MLVSHPPDLVVSGWRLGRYVDWLLTVPLLLIELILVMQLPAEESSRKMWTLGAASGFMVAFGYPGEVRDDPAGRWFYWAVSMCPFMYVPDPSGALASLVTRMVGGRVPLCFVTWKRCGSQGVA